jgi:spore coat protein H
MPFTMTHPALGLAALLACASPSSGEDSTMPPDSGGDPGEELPSVASCDPQLSWSPPQPYEGEAVVGTLSCASAIDGFEPRLEAAPVGMSLDGWGLAWTPGPDDGGDHPIVLVFTHSGTLPEVLEASLGVADNPEVQGAVPLEPWFYTHEWGLPVLHLAPDAPLGQTYGEGDVVFLGEQGRAEMKIRGATSASFPKPGYTLHFNQGNLDLGDFGMGKRDKLVLVSTFDDNSQLRQKLAYDLWAELARLRGDDTRLVPRSFFTILYIDGVYRGIYMALDHIDDEFVQDMGGPAGTDIFKAVSHDANFSILTSGGASKSSLHQGYEKKEGTPTHGEPGAYDPLDALVDFTGRASPTTLADEGADWLDIDDFIDWWLFVRFSNAEDSGGKNSYLVSLPGETPFRFSPWDMNHSWGQDWMTLRVASDHDNDFRSANRVFDLMLRHDELGATMAEAWLAHTEPGGPFSQGWLHDQIDGHVATLGRSIERDWARWGDEYASYGLWAGYRSHYGDLNTAEGELAYLRRWAEERAAWALTAAP